MKHLLKYDILRKNKNKYYEPYVKEQIINNEITKRVKEYSKNIYYMDMRSTYSITFKIVFVK